MDSIERYAKALEELFKGKTIHRLSTKHHVKTGPYVRIIFEENPDTPHRCGAPEGFEIENVFVNTVRRVAPFGEMQVAEDDEGVSFNGVDVNGHIMFILEFAPKEAHR